MSRDILCPPLAIPLRFSREAALLDKVDLGAGDWIAEGTPDALQHFLFDLSQTTLEDPDWEHARVFQQRSLRHERKDFLRVLGPGQGRGSQSRPALVFGGTININPVAQSSSPETQRLSIRANLRLNLNRYLQAQPLGGGRLKRLERRYGPPKLVIAPDDSWYSQEAPFVPDTNLLIGSSFRFRYAASRNILDHFAEYFDAVVGFLDRRLRSIAQESACQLVHRYHLSLQRVEACWEFSTPSPIGYVNSVWPQLEAVARSASTRSIEVSNPTTNIDGMSRSVSVWLNRTTQLRLYAKTSGNHDNELGRVRYEAVLDERGLGAVIGPRTSQEADQTAVLRRWLEQCIQHGMAQLAHAETLIDASPRFGADRQPPYSLLLHIVRASGSLPLSEALTASLVHERCIRLHDLSIFRRAVGRLVDAGVLRRTGSRSQMFVLTDEYAGGLEALRDLLRDQG